VERVFTVNADEKSKGILILKVGGVTLLQLASIKKVGYSVQSNFSRPFVNSATKLVLSN